jgi:hypothetical protein
MDCEEVQSQRESGSRLLEGRICACSFVPGIIHVVQDILEVVAHDDGSLQRHLHSDSLVRCHWFLALLLISIEYFGVCLYFIVAQRRNSQRGCRAAIRARDLTLLQLGVLQYTNATPSVPNKSGSYQ